MAHKFEVMLDMPRFSTAVFLSVNVDKLTNKKDPDKQHWTCDTENVGIKTQNL